MLGPQVRHRERGVDALPPRLLPPGEPAAGNNAVTCLPGPELTCHSCRAWAGQVPVFPVGPCRLSWEQSWARSWVAGPLSPLWTQWVRCDGWARPPGGGGPCEALCSLAQSPSPVPCSPDECALDGQRLLSPGPCPWPAAGWVRAGTEGPPWAPPAAVLWGLTGRTGEVLSGRLLLRDRQCLCPRGSLSACAAGHRRCRGDGLGWIPRKDPCPQRSAGAVRIWPQ